MGSEFGRRVRMGSKGLLQISQELFNHPQIDVNLCCCAFNDSAQPQPSYPAWSKRGSVGTCGLLFGRFWQAQTCANLVLLLGPFNFQSLPTKQRRGNNHSGQHDASQPVDAGASNCPGEIYNYYTACAGYRDLARGDSTTRDSLRAR